METKHNFVHLAEVQREQGTLYCAGLDPHSFGSGNVEVYGTVTSGSEYTYYYTLSRRLNLDCDKARTFAGILAGVERYTCNILTILVEGCNIRVFKPNAAFYNQFGAIGSFMLWRVRRFLSKLELEKGIRLIVQIDCKNGDISTTQSCSFLGMMGNLLEDWGIDFEPFGFDIMNVTPWMGEDVMVLVDDKGNPDRGLKLMRQGKGIIGVNKTSNPSGPQYQDIPYLSNSTVQLKHVEDSARWTKEYDLGYDGLSSIGLVVGSTHVCNGEIRALFPSTTLLVPGFGAQGGAFNKIMLELIRHGKWNGQGAMFSSSRGTMYPHLKKYGGSGDIINLEEDLIAAVLAFRENEFNAYQTAEVRDAGIKYPF